MSLQFGLSLPQGWTMDLASIKDPVEAYEAMTRVAQTADEVGFESAWLVDHFHTIPQPSQEVTFECWTSTAAIARDTRRIRIGQMVTCNGYRHPALLAKMASTVDVLSHGRLDFGMGAGWYEQEFRAYGYDFPDGPTRLRQLRDAVQKPHIPLLIGGGGKRVTLKLVAQYADACNIGHLDNAGLEHKFAVIKKHCEEVGRDYNTIKRTVMFNCAIAETDEAAMSKTAPFARNIPSGRIHEQALVGSPATIRQRLAEIEQAGAQEIIVYMPDSKDLESIRMFAHECMQR